MDQPRPKDRKTRLAEALRSNLRARKEQARAKRGHASVPQKEADNPPSSHEG